MILKYPKKVQKNELFLLLFLYYALYNIIESVVFEVFMKQQVKKGVLEIFVLAILMKEDSYGYKIVSDLSQYIEMSESTLYPILRRLEKQDELSTYNELYQGRNRKYYQITMKGKKHIQDFMDEWEDVRKIYDILMK